MEEHEYTYYTSIEGPVDEPVVVLKVTGFRDLEDANDIATMINDWLAGDEISVSVH